MTSYVIIHRTYALLKMVHFFGPPCIMTESDSDTSFFPRCPDKQFWADDDRVQPLITLYHNADRLWNPKCADYKKSLTKKKTAKEETGLHFG